MKKRFPIFSASVALILLLLCTPALAQVSTINHKGNVFELKVMADTTEILDPVTMETIWEIRNPDPIPLKLNNMNIYAVNEVGNQPSVSGETLRRFIIGQLNAHLKKDGEYRLMLDNIVINDKGKIVYYNFKGIEKKVTTHTQTIEAGKSSSPVSYAMSRADWKETDKNLSSFLSTQIEKIIDIAPTYKPALVYNQPVPCLLDTKELQRPFFVRNGLIQY